MRLLGDLLIHVGIEGKHTSIRCPFEVEDAEHVPELTWLTGVFELFEEIGVQQVVGRILGLMMDIGATIVFSTLTAIWCRRHR